MKQFKCKGCGEIDSIVEVQLEPQIQTVRPEQAENAVPFEDVDYGGYEGFHEAIVVLGFGCRNESCQFWQGNWGAAYPKKYETRLIHFERAKDLDEIAEIVEE